MKHLTFAVVAYASIACAHALPTYNVVNLGTLGGIDAVPTGINNAEQVVGFARTANFAQHAFLYSNGTMTDLGTLGGTNSYANSINDAGQVVGHARTSNGYDHAFLYSNGSMTDLGTLGGTNSYANGINNAGQVVGHSPTNNGFHAFLYSNGSMTDLGTLGGAYSFAHDINNTGQVVGYAYTNNGQHAFLYSNGSMTDLNSLIDPLSGWTILQARAINDLGDIAAYGCHAISGCRALMLDYIQAAPEGQVPEPGSLALLGLGLAALARRQAARKH